MTAVNPVASSAAAAAASSTSNIPNLSSTLNLSFTDYLQILTTQLQNQDPTDATDPNQFTQELVEFAGVEQQLNTNSDLQTLINIQKTGGVASTLSYIGGYVEAPTTNQLALQNGQAEIGY